MREGNEEVINCHQGKEISLSRFPKTAFSIRWALFNPFKLVPGHALNFRITQQFKGSEFPHFRNYIVHRLEPPKKRQLKLFKLLFCKHTPLFLKLKKVTFRHFEGQHTILSCDNIICLPLSLHLSVSSHAWLGQFQPNLVQNSTDHPPPLNKNPINHL